MDSDTKCHCISGVPQRLNGKVYGELNGYPIDNLDMHVYIVTRDGRAYTAISRIPTQLEGNMRSLVTIGGIMGWMFAQPQHPDAKNGLMLSGNTMTFFGAILNFHNHYARAF